MTSLLWDVAQVAFLSLQPQLLSALSHCNAAAPVRMHGALRSRYLVNTFGRRNRTFQFSSAQTILKRIITNARPFHDDGYPRRRAVSLPATANDSSEGSTTEGQTLPAAIALATTLAPAALHTRIPTTGADLNNEGRRRRATTRSIFLGELMFVGATLLLAKGCASAAIVSASARAADDPDAGHEPSHTGRDVEGRDADRRIPPGQGSGPESSGQAARTGGSRAEEQGIGQGGDVEGWKHEPADPVGAGLPIEPPTLRPATVAEVAHDAPYYFKCALGGLISCGTTHTGLTPLDVAKCNMQADPSKYKGLRGSVSTIAEEEGRASLWKGWLPTLLGYSMQGCFKFGLYEFCKDEYSALLGDDMAYLYRGLVCLAAAASAEFVADTALCPLEMVKVKVQTSPRGTFPTAFLPAVLAMWENSSLTRFPFGSLVPLWSRQIPYTMTKFFFFEKIVEVFYSTMLTQPRRSYGLDTQLAVTFASGYLAGIICAVVSQPADTVVSKMGKESQKSPGQVLSELGFTGIWGGLGTRMFVTGTLTGLQWWIYDTFKSVAGLGLTGT